MVGALPYLLTFAVAAFLFWLSERTRGPLRVILVLAALVLPALLAGFRDKQVGTDVMVYGYNSYTGALDSDLPGYLEGNASYHPLGFNVFSWAMSRLGGTLWFYLTSIQLFTSSFVYLALRKLRGVGLWAGMLAYYVLLFPISLNTMKQMMAVAVVLWAFTFCLERRLLPFLAAVVFATLFHQTAVVFVAVYPCWRAFESIGTRRAFFGRAQGFMFHVLLAAGLFLVFVLGDRLVQFFSAFKDSYQYVLNASSDRLNYSGLILLASGLVLLAVVKASGRGRSADSPPDGEGPSLVDDGLEFYALMFVVGCIAIQLNTVATSLMRFSYYGLIFASPLLGGLMADGRGRSLRIAGWLTIVLFFAYFFVAYVLNGGNAIVPYTSTILGL
ncbi:MAG: EpsG family protein [Actinomyces sp.]|jgi:hypothetical protein|uniref:EpsG family protein n=1 Tax=Schaalia naturae TaxID=635203 RepID=A0ABW2SK63_9ACTO|nr:EpsG family protein [Actinomyces sp.]MCI1788350.1 EpsG family protein [Actinomyces sp.]